MRCVVLNCVESCVESCIVYCAAQPYPKIINWILIINQKSCMCYELFIFKIVWRDHEQRHHHWHNRTDTHTLHNSSPKYNHVQTLFEPKTVKEIYNTYNTNGLQLLCVRIVWNCHPKWMSLFISAGLVSHKNWKRTPTTADKNFVMPEHESALYTVCITSPAYENTRSNILARSIRKQ